TDTPRFIEVVRNFIRAHVAMYEAIKEADTVDADGDGVAAQVGMTLSLVAWSPARDNEPSDDPEDVAAAELMRYVYHEMFPQAVIEGRFDPNFDGVPEEEHPEWAGHLDWLGPQYYFRAGVTAKVPLLPLLGVAVCFSGFDFGSCLDPEDPTFWVPSMEYEYWAPGLSEILIELSERWPNLPLVVTEAGIATENGDRRSENIVRTLEQIRIAQDQGADIRGYYHWSLLDNFEWSEGFEPRFGLFHVDFETGERSPSSAVSVLSEITLSRRVSPELRQRFGGVGVMTEE
ncbi:MAG: family 1 glycosylhydrolase, partial [Myxococcales bacterium]|nr:family 1 glycosylhydrolase [Myxococcales bacterium]